MRDFAVLWEPQAVLDLVSARVFLGVVRAATLNHEVERIEKRLAALPESGQKVKIRGGWSTTAYKIPLSQSPFILYYRLSLDAESVVIAYLRHERARQPEF